MQNAEIQLDAAKFFLDQLQNNLKESRAFYHNTAALLNAVYALGESLEAEGEQHYNNARKTWRKGLTKEERLLVDEIIGLRGKAVHNAEGISLHPNGVRLTSNSLDKPATITLRKEGAESILQLSIPASITGAFEDTTNVPLSAADLLESGPLVIETLVAHGDSTSGVNSLPLYRFDGSKLLFPDALSACQQVVGLADRFLQDFRLGKI